MQLDASYLTSLSNQILHILHQGVAQWVHLILSFMHPFQPLGLSSPSWKLKLGHISYTSVHPCVYQTPVSNWLHPTSAVSNLQIQLGLYILCTAPTGWVHIGHKTNKRCPYIQISSQNYKCDVKDQCSIHSPKIQQSHRNIPQWEVPRWSPIHRSLKKIMTKEFKELNDIRNSPIKLKRINLKKKCSRKQK